MASKMNATSETGYDRYIGASMEQFLNTCWDTEPWTMAWMNGSAVLSLLVTIGLLARHIASLKQAKLSLRRAQYRTIACLPTVFGVTAIIPLFSPSSVMVSMLIQKVYEAYCLYTFGLILFVLLTHESTQSSSIEIGTQPPVQSITDALATQGPKKHFATPPLCCCCGPLMSPCDLSVSHLRYLFWMIKQYVFCMTLVGLASTYSLTAFSFDLFKHVVEMLKYPMMCSNLLCLYGLFVLYWSTHDLLHRWNTTKKFAAIKIILILMIYQDWILDRFGKAFFSHHDSCFKHMGYTHYAWEFLEAKRWGCWLVVLEMVPMALMIQAAFTVDDLEVTIEETHHDMLAMAFRQHKTDESSSDEESGSDNQVPSTSAEV